MPAKRRVGIGRIRQCTTHRQEGAIEQPRTLFNVLVTAIAPLIWGSTYFVTTQFLPPDAPLLAALMRALPAGIVLVIIGRRLPVGVWWWRSTLLGILNIGAFFYFLFVTAYQLPGGVAALLISTQPVIVLLDGILLYGQKISVVQAIACVLGIAGLALVVLKPSAALNMTGVIAGLCAAVCMATGIVLTKHWGKPTDVSIFTFTGWQLTAGGLSLLPFILLQESIPQVLSATNMLGFVYLSLVGTLVAYVIWFRGIEHLPAPTVSFLGLLSPVSAVLLGFVLLSESLTAPQILGAICVLTAVLLVQVYTS